ncbi:MAG: hypothetical protein ACK41F_07085 [Fimbriimonadaceae bacterium]
MRSCTKASVLLGVLVAAAGCSPAGPAGTDAPTSGGGFEERWSALSREAERLRDRWNPAWAEEVERKAAQLKRSLDGWKIPEEERRRRERQLSELLESLRSAEALRKAREGLSGLGKDAEPALNEARDRVARALEALEGGRPREGRRPYP